MATSARAALGRGWRATADLCDLLGDRLRYVDCLGWRDLGGKPRFCGPVATVQCMEDNTQVKAAVAEAGHGRVLVIHAGGCRTRAVVGDQIAKLAEQNGWAGFLVNGCVRDAVELANVPVGVKALGTHPRKTEKRGDGLRDVPVTFGGVTFVPGQDFVVCDEDGIVVGQLALFDEEQQAAT